MNEKFRQAIADLKQVHEEFAAGRVSSVEHGATRAAAIITALEALADMLGVRLQEMHAIDSRGELHLTALDGDKDPRLGCGKFGWRLAALLNLANPRTGTVPCELTQDAGWCFINHFAAETLVLRYFEMKTLYRYA
jgi:hypothetical protein